MPGHEVEGGDGGDAPQGGVEAERQRPFAQQPQEGLQEVGDQRFLSPANPPPDAEVPLRHIEGCHPIARLIEGQPRRECLQHGQTQSSRNQYSQQEKSPRG